MKLFSQANRIDASILAQPYLGGNTGGPLTFGGIGDPVFSCVMTQIGGGPFPYGVDAGYNIVEQKYIDVVTAHKNGSNSYVANIDTAGGGGIATILGGSAVGFYENLLGINTGVGGETALGAVPVTMAARTPGGNLSLLPVSIWGGGMVSNHGGTPFHYNGQDFLIMGLDPSGNTGLVILGNLSGTMLAQVWNGFEIGYGMVNRFSSWTDRLYNYFLVDSSASSAGRCYIVKCDISGNEISRDYLSAADPVIDLCFQNWGYFLPCAKGFMSYIYGGIPGNTFMNGLLLVAPDGSSYTVYECGALDIATATDFAGWGDTLETAYIDKNDVVYVATNSGWAGATNAIYVSLADRNPSMYAQPLGPCWPCLPTARGIA